MSKRQINTLAIHAICSESYNCELTIYKKTKHS